ncbi:MAG: BadF/BadG/BcrA/BcrD ATPase family protein [Nocardioides sp.]
MGLTDAAVEAVLAIDAGNSKTDVCVVSAEGDLLARARGGSFRPHRIGAGPALAEITPAVEAALAAAGNVRVAHAAACLANVDFPAEEQALEAAIAGLGWATSYEVLNDTYALLRAGLDEARGVAVVCGAGINCTGVLPDGTTVRFAAVGHISGDWGGGDHLWVEAMWWAARAEDGRGPDTALRTALPQYFGLASMAALIEAVHVGGIPEERHRDLGRVLFEIADAGDPIAADVVRRQAEEVVTLAATAIHRLGAVEEPIDVVLGGGVLTAGHALLMDAITSGLAEQAPKAAVRVVAEPPILGAALLGLDRIGAPRAAQDRLRAAFAPVG